MQCRLYLFGRTATSNLNAPFVTVRRDSPQRRGAVLSRQYTAVRATGRSRVRSCLSGDGHMLTVQLATQCRPPKCRRWTSAAVPVSLWHSQGCKARTAFAAVPRQVLQLHGQPARRTAARVARRIDSQTAPHDSEAAQMQKSQRRFPVTVRGRPSRPLLAACIPNRSGGTGRNSASRTTTGTQAMAS